jgi:predicted ATPase
VSFVSPVTHRVELFQITALSSLNDEDVRRAVIDVMRAFDPGVKNLEIVDRTGARSTLRVWHDETGTTPVSAFGDGFRRVLTYALALAECQGGVLLIDEIESAIHFSALTQVFSWLVEAAHRFSVQLVVSTHSLEALDALLVAAEPKVPLAHDIADEVVLYRTTRQNARLSIHRLEGRRALSLRRDGALEVR